MKTIEIIIVPDSDKQLGDCGSIIFIKKAEKEIDVLCELEDALLNTNTIMSSILESDYIYTLVRYNKNYTSKTDRSNPDYIADYTYIVDLKDCVIKGISVEELRNHISSHAQRTREVISKYIIPNTEIVARKEYE